MLLDNVEMPLSEQLPVDMLPLAFKNAFRVRQGIDFSTDMKRLSDEIDKTIITN